MDGRPERVALILHDTSGIGAAVVSLLNGRGGVAQVRGSNTAVIDAIVDEIRWEGADAIAMVGDAWVGGVEIQIVSEGASQAA